MAFVRGIHRGPGNSPHKWPVTRKKFPVDDVIMLKIIPLLPSKDFTSADEATLTNMGQLITLINQEPMIQLGRNKAHQSCVHITWDIAGNSS